MEFTESLNINTNRAELIQINKIVLNQLYDAGLSFDIKILISAALMTVLTVLTLG